METPIRAMRFPVWGRAESLEDDEVVRATGLVRLRGRAVREAALAVLVGARGGVLSLGEVLVAFDDRGLEVVGPEPNKVLSDALGYEVGKGRVRRVARGLYAVGVVARTSAWRLRRRWGLRCWAGALWHPDREWRLTRFGRQAVPPGLLRLTQRRSGVDLAQRLRHWQPGGWEAPLDGGAVPPDREPRPTTGLERPGLGFVG